MLREIRFWSDKFHIFGKYGLKCVSSFAKAKNLENFVVRRALVFCKTPIIDGYHIMINNNFNFVVSIGLVKIALQKYQLLINQCLSKYGKAFPGF